MKLFFYVTLPLLLGVTLSGCSQHPDERLAELTQQVTHEQAAQNERVAEANRLVAQSHERLLEADAQSRTDLIALQQDLRADQVDVQHQRDQLEAERRDIASERRTDSATGQGLVALALIIACLAPLVLAAASLFGQYTEPTEGEVCSVLLEELRATDSPRLADSPDNVALPPAHNDDQ